MSLLARIRAREPDAFEALYRRYQPRLARFAMHLVGRPALVEEVVNDTMMAVWHRPESFRGASKLSTWIFAIAYRIGLKARRRRDAPVEPRADAAAAGPEAMPDATAGRRRVRDLLAQAMTELSAEHRAVVDLTYFHEIGYREIAEIMDCPVDTVKTRMFHARRHLKRKLAGELADWL